MSCAVQTLQMGNLRVQTSPAHCCRHIIHDLPQSVARGSFPPLIKDNTDKQIPYRGTFYLRDHVGLDFGGLRASKLSVEDSVEDAHKKINGSDGTVHPILKLVMWASRIIQFDPSALVRLLLSRHISRNANRKLKAIITGKLELKLKALPGIFSRTPKSIFFSLTGHLEYLVVHFFRRQVMPLRDATQKQKERPLFYTLIDGYIFVPQ